MEDLVETLTSMEMILRRYGRSGQADIVSRAILLATTKDPRLRDCLDSVDFWGGAGAVWEVYLDEEFSDDRQRKVDARKFDAAVGRLAEIMESRGWASPRVRQVASLSKDWNPVHNPKVLLQSLYVLVPIILIALIFVFWDRW